MLLTVVGNVSFLLSFLLRRHDKYDRFLALVPSIRGTTLSRARTTAANVAKPASKELRLQLRADSARTTIERGRKLTNLTSCILVIEDYLRFLIIPEL